MPHFASSPRRPPESNNSRRTRYRVGGTARPCLAAWQIRGFAADSHWHRSERWQHDRSGFRFAFRGPRGCNQKAGCSQWKKVVWITLGLLMSPLIEIAGVGRVYGSPDARVRALNHINLTVKNGEFVAIMGPSGSGKSTLMNISGPSRSTDGRTLLVWRRRRWHFWS